MTEYLFFFSLASPLTVAMELGISDITDQCVYILAVGVWRWKAECEDWTNTTRTYRVSKPAGVQLQTQRPSRLLPDPHRRAICRTRSHRDKRVYMNEKEFKLTDFKAFSSASDALLHRGVTSIHHFKGLIITQHKNRDAFHEEFPSRRRQKKSFLLFFMRPKWKNSLLKTSLGCFYFK